MIDFFTSHIFLTIIISWLVAKIIKTTLRLSKNWPTERLLTAGGFPSEHTALVSALFMSTAFETNWDPITTSITLIFAIVVMYDAAGVRFQSGLHAKALNGLLPEETPLEESLGHKKLEVLGGLVVGIVVSVLSYYLVSSF